MTVLEELPLHLNKDFDLHPTCDIICGPLKASILLGSNWRVPGCFLVVKTFKMVKPLKPGENKNVCLNKM